MTMLIFLFFFSRSYHGIAEETFQEESFLYSSYIHRHFLTFGWTCFGASASLYSRNWCWSSR